MSSQETQYSGAEGVACKHCQAVGLGPFRLFARKFPGVNLQHFHADRRESGPWTRDCHYVFFEGPPELLLQFGLVSSDMIAPKPKRLAYGDDQGSRCTWRTERVRGKRVRVWRELLDAFDRNHPLADFGVWNWPIYDTAADRREARLLAAEEFRRCLRAHADNGVLRFVAEGKSPREGARFCVDASTLEQIRAITLRSKAELDRVIADARVVDLDKRTPALRLVRTGGVA